MAAVLEVAAAVIRDGDRYLACRRLPHKTAGGKWEFPGGKIEPGEAPIDALRREIREELGIDVEVGEVLRVDVAGGIRLTCLSATLAGARPTHSTDHDRLEWVRAAELTALDWAAPDLPMVRALAAG